MFIVLTTSQALLDELVEFQTEPSGVGIPITRLEAGECGRLRNCSSVPLGTLCLEVFSGGLASGEGGLSGEGFSRVK